jgi:hypothetical protein
VLASASNISLEMIKRPSINICNIQALLSFEGVGGMGHSPRKGDIYGGTWG